MSLRSLRFDRSPTVKCEKVGDRLRVMASVSRVGTLRYLRADGAVQEEIVEDDELFNQDSLDTAGLCPVTWGHPSSGRADWRKDSIGSSGSTVVARADQGLVDVVFVVGDRASVDQIESAVARGERLQVSAGYDTEVVQRDGKFYQTKRRYDHFAILPSGVDGRAGASVSLHTDAGDWGMQVDESVVSESKVDEKKEPMATLKLDGKDYEMDEATYAAVKAHIDSLSKPDSVTTTKTDAANDAAIAVLKGEIDKLTTRCDTAEATAKTLQQKLDAVGDLDEKVKTAVQSRVDAYNKVIDYLPKEIKFDAATAPHEYARAAVVATLPAMKEKLDSATPERIWDAYEMMSQLNPKTKNDKADNSTTSSLLDQIRQAQGQGGEQRSDTGMSARDKARKKQEEAMSAQEIF